MIKQQSFVMPFQNMFTHFQKVHFSKCYEKLSVFQTFQLDPEAEPRGIL